MVPNRQHVDPRPSVLVSRILSGKHARLCSVERPSGGEERVPEASRGPQHPPASVWHLHTHIGKPTLEYKSPSTSTIKASVVDDPMTRICRRGAAEEAGVGGAATDPECSPSLRGLAVSPHLLFPFCLLLALLGALSTEQASFAFPTSNPQQPSSSQSSYAGLEFLSLLPPTHLSQPSFNNHSPIQPSGIYAFEHQARGFFRSFINPSLGSKACSTLSASNTSAQTPKTHHDTEQTPRPSTSSTQQRHAHTRRPAPVHCRLPTHPTNGLFSTRRASINPPIHSYNQACPACPPRRLSSTPSTTTDSRHGSAAATPTAASAWRRPRPDWPPTAHRPSQKPLGADPIDEHVCEPGQ